MNWFILGNILALHLFTPPITTTQPITIVVWSTEVATQVTYLNTSNQIGYWSPVAYWSPITNEMLISDYDNFTVTTDYSMFKASAPDFQLTRLLTQPVNSLTDFGAQWSPDAYYIVYFDPTLKRMNSDGRDIVTINSDLRVFRDNDNFEGWASNDTFVYTIYTGGGSNQAIWVDILSGQYTGVGNISSLLPHPHNNYVAITSYDMRYPSMGPGVFTIPTQFTGTIAYTTATYYIQDDYIENYHLWGIKPNSGGMYNREINVNAIARDWLPQTNQLLFSSNSEERGITYAEELPPEMRVITQTHQLMLWDLGTQQTHILVADAIDSDLSPDGKTLAYLSLWPTHLDANQHPISKTTSVTTRYDSPENIPNIRNQHQNYYLQLMDMATQRVSFTVPVAMYEWYSYSDTWSWLDFVFFPDSRYLLYFTSGRFLVANQNVVYHNNFAYLNLLDLQKFRLP